MKKFLSLSVVGFSVFVVASCSSYRDPDYFGDAYTRAQPKKNIKYSQGSDSVAERKRLEKAGPGVVKVDPPQLEYRYIPIEIEAPKRPETLLGERKVQYTNSVDNYSFQSGVVEYTYRPDEIYTVFLTPINVTDIRLEAGEEVMAVVMGIPTQWKVEQVKGYEQGQSFVHVLVRPLTTGITSDCLIITDRRTYNLFLNSTTNVAMVALRWNYMDARYGNGSMIAMAASKETEEESAGISADLSLANFNYSISGKNFSWTPIRVFSDTKKTYIQFKNEFLYSSEVPVLYLDGPNGRELVNYTQKGVNIVVPFVMNASEHLVLKVDRNEVNIEQR